MSVPLLHLNQLSLLLARRCKTWRRRHVTWRTRQHAFYAMTCRRRHVVSKSQLCKRILSKSIASILLHNSLFSASARHSVKYIASILLHNALFSAVLYSANKQTHTLSHAMASFAICFANSRRPNSASKKAFSPYFAGKCVLSTLS